MKQGGKKIPGRGTSVCKDSVRHRVARPLQTCGQSTVGDGGGGGRMGQDRQSQGQTYVLCAMLEHQSVLFCFVFLL